MKQCSKCLSHKPLMNFRVSPMGKDGHHSYCRGCERAYSSAWAKENKEYRRANQKNYRKRNPGKVNALNGKRRAAQLQRTPKWLTKFDLAYIQAFYIAAKALSKELGIKFQVDHIMPLQGDTVSGLHVPNNLQIITQRENASKRNKVAA